MNRISQHLINLSDHLDKTGKVICADAVDRLLVSGAMQKVAQYVGVIGYVLKQERAMSNCIRKKRVASTQSMQEVVLSCLKEYQDGQNYQNDDWTNKYASLIRQAPIAFDKTHLAFLAALGQEANIEQHITILEKTAEILEDHNVEDEMMNQVLSHVRIYGDILKKEANVGNPDGTFR